MSTPDLSKKPGAAPNTKRPRRARRKKNIIKDFQRSIRGANVATQDFPYCEALETCDWNEKHVFHIPPDTTMQGVCFSFEVQKLLSKSAVIAKSVKKGRREGVGLVVGLRRNGGK